MTWKQTKTVLPRELTNKKAPAPAGAEALIFSGAPREIRTPGLLIRSQTLYPAELVARMRLNLIADFGVYVKSFFAIAGIPLAGIPHFGHPQGAPLQDPSRTLFAIFEWRRGRDSNPRYRLTPYTRLAGERLQPTRPPLRTYPTNYCESIFFNSILLPPGTDYTRPRAVYGGGGRIRTHGAFTQRFSRPPP